MITERISRMNKEATAMRLRYAKGVVRVLGEEKSEEVVYANQFFKAKDVKEEVETYGFHILSIGYSEHEMMNFLYSMTNKVRNPSNSANNPG